MYQIKSIEELKTYFINNNIKNSNDLGKLGLDYWNNNLKPLIKPELFEKPKTKEELLKLIDDNFPLLLIDTSDITEFQSLFENDLEDDNNLKIEKYWENSMNFLGFWNISNTINISVCFYNQKYFNQHIFWNTNNVKNASYLFCFCETFNQPIKLDLPNCQDISWMFFGCENLNIHIKLNNLKNVTKAKELFYNCQKLNFDNIKTVINQLITKVKNIKELEEDISYRIPEEYKNQIQNKQFIIINQI